MPASNQHAAVKTTESTALSAWLRPIILRKRANSHRNWPPPVASVNAGMHDIALGLTPHTFGPLCSSSQPLNV